MYHLSGFVRIAALIQNQPNRHSVLGELSSRSATFSRELGHYHNHAYPDVRLTSFHSTQDDVAVQVNPTFSDISLQVSQWLFERAIDGSLSDDKENTRQQLLSEFGSIIDLQRVGDMVTDGTYWLPEQIVFTLLDQIESNIIRLWYADASFQRQYDKYEILVVPIFDPLDAVHGPRESALALLNTITVSSVLQKADTLAGEYPPTEVVSQEYDWVDKNDRTITKSTPWTVIIYGGAGNNADLIREALIDWILGNSAEPREEWEKIYPDLFLPNEFYITPTWDLFSIPNQLASTGLYSPTLKYDDMMDYGVSTFYGIPLLHIRKQMTHSVAIYKSLGFVSVGHHRNRNEIYSFGQLWPEYATIGSDRIDFNKLPPKTAEFIMLLTQMLLVADTLDQYNNIPAGMSIVVRGENQYLAATFDKMLYLVSLKTNVITDHSDPDPVDPGAGTQYGIEIITDRDGVTGVVAQLYEITEDPGGDGQTFTPIDVGVPVNWDAIWYDAQDNVYLSNEIIGGSSDQLIFTQHWDGGSAGRIYATATFSGITVAVDYQLQPY